MPFRFGTACTGLFTPIDARNLRVFAGWVVAAALSFALALVVLESDLTMRRSVGEVLAGATVVTCLGALRAYVLFLRGSDELLRKIQMEGLALGSGAAAVFSLCYRLFERLGARSLPISTPFVVMMFFWAIGLAIGMRRFTSQDD